MGAMGRERESELKRIGTKYQRSLFGFMMEIFELEILPPT